MKAARPIIMLVALLLVTHVGLSALSYYGRKSFCLFPPHFVNDEERIDRALTAFHELSRQNLKRRVIDRESCCSVVRSRSAPEFGVYFRTVLLGKWEEIVEIKYGPDQGTLAFLRSGRCGEVVIDRD